MRRKRPPRAQQFIKKDGHNQVGETIVGVMNPGRTGDPAKIEAARAEHAEVKQKVRGCPKP
jgi:hypothetical protein